MLDILTHETVGDRIKSPPGPDGGATTTTLESNRIWHDGQIIAVVVADTFEAAREAADKVRVEHRGRAASASFDCAGRRGASGNGSRPARREGRSREKSCR